MLDWLTRPADNIGIGGTDSEKNIGHSTDWNTRNGTHCICRARAGRAERVNVTDHMHAGVGAIARGCSCRQTHVGARSYRMGCLVQRDLSNLAPSHHRNVSHMWHRITGGAVDEAVSAGACPRQRGPCMHMTRSTLTPQRRRPCWAQDLCGCMRVERPAMLQRAGRRLQYCVSSRALLWGALHGADDNYKARQWRPVQAVCENPFVELQTDTACGCSVWSGRAGTPQRPYRSPRWRHPQAPPV